MTDSKQIDNERQHEPDLDSARCVAWVSAGLAALVLAALALVSGMLLVLDRESSAPAAKSLVTLPPPPPTVGPRLNPDQSGQLHALRQQQEALLDSYGWVDPSRGIARIPIRRAMAVLAERGLTSASNDDPPSSDAEQQSE
jgi:hypothetical protein